MQDLLHLHRHVILLLLSLVFVLLPEVSAQSTTAEVTSTTFSGSTATTDEGSTQETSPPETNPPVVSSSSSTAAPITSTSTTVITTPATTTRTTTTATTTTSPVLTPVTLPSMSCCTPQQLGEVIQIILELLALEGIIPGLGPTTTTSPSQNSTMDYHSPPAVPGGPHDSHNRPHEDHRPVSGFDSQYPYIPVHFGESNGLFSANYFGVSGIRDQNDRGNEDKDKHHEDLKPKKDHKPKNDSKKPQKYHKRKKGPSKIPVVPNGSRRSWSHPLSPRTLSLTRVGKNKKDVTRNGFKVNVEKSKWRNKFKFSLGKRNIVLSKKEILTLIQNSYARSFDWRRTSNNKFLYKCKILKKCKRNKRKNKRRQGKKSISSKSARKIKKKLKRDKSVPPTKISDRSSNSVISWLKKIAG